MRAGLISILIAASASAAYAEDDALSVGAAIGAGGQGSATYGAVELRLDALWRDVRIGLGGRAVWEDGVFRRRDWSRPIDAITLIRQLEARTEHLAIAAGALTPAQLGRVVEQYRVSLDDRLRTGARGSLTTKQLTLGLEIDDVLDPVLIGGAAAVQLSTPWTIHAATAVDPTAPGGVASAIELGVAHRWDAKDRRIELGSSLIAEPRAGLAIVGFATGAMEHAGARWSATADVRAGNGTNGAAFGPLYRVERIDLYERARTGVGAGLTTAVAAEAGWVSATVRARPGLGPLGSLSAGAPANRWVQAGAWIAVTPDAAAGAAEVRVAWARRLYSALQLARMYETDEMTAVPSWSATAWFGAN